MTTLIPKYDEGATGAVNRPFNEKLQEYVSVLDFGADPTGATNSSTAFTNAVATGKAVYIPKGTYQCSFDISSYQILYGDGLSTILIPPTGATYVIRMDATTVAKQWCQISNLSIANTNSVANCVGILFKGTDVNTINDNHVIRNVVISNLDRALEATGRLIGCSFYNVTVSGGVRIGFNISTDTVNPACILNSWYMCLFLGSTQQALKIIGLNVTNSFYSSNFQGANSSNVAGVAATEIHDSQMIQFTDCYWESNGLSVAVDTTNYLNNSIGLWLTGNYCFEPKIENSYIVGSGVLIAMDASVGGIGGYIGNNTFIPTANGWDIYNKAATNSNTSAAVTIDGNNIFNGKTTVVQDVNGQYNAYIRQIKTCRYIASNQTIDLRTMSKLEINVASPTTITTITNLIAGCELWIKVPNAAVTIPATYMASGSDLVIATGTSKILMVSTANKFVVIV